MQDLIGALVSQLGIHKSQAQGGAGALFKAAKDRLGDSEFESLLGGLPGVKTMLSHAPSSGGGGLLGGLASMASKMGGGDMAQAAQLLTAFSSLGLNKDMAMKFLPVIMQFLQAHGGPELVTKVKAALKM